MKRKIFPITILVHIAAVGAMTAGQFRGSDDFNDNSLNPSVWSQAPFVSNGTVYENGFNMLAETSERLNHVRDFSIGSYTETFLRWTANQGSYTNDWFVQSEFTIGDDVLSTEGPLLFSWVAFSLEISDAANMRNRVRLRFVDFLNGSSVWEHSAHWIAQTDGVSSGAQGTQAISGSNVVARITWDASAERFEFLLDTTGAQDGFEFTSIGSMNIGSSGAGWGMSAGSGFRFRLVTDSETQADFAFVRRAYADNVRLVSGPILSQQPTTATYTEGEQAVIDVSVEPDASQAFFWYRDGELLPEQNAEDLVLPFVSVADAGEYVLTLTNEVGSVSSQPITLSITPNPALPVFLSQPRNISSYVGQTIEFSVAVQSDSPVSYQWFKNGTELPGRTGDTLELTALKTTDAGVYKVLVTNSAGSKFSSGGQLTVAATPPPRLRYDIVGSSLIIHWPVSQTGFKLWYSDTTATGNWVEHPGPFTLYQGNRIAIQAAFQTGTRFYRLQK